MLSTRRQTRPRGTFANSPRTGPGCGQRTGACHGTDEPLFSTTTPQPHPTTPRTGRRSTPRHTYTERRQALIFVLRTQDEPRCQVATNVVPSRCVLDRDSTRGEWQGGPPLLCHSTKAPYPHPGPLCALAGPKYQTRGDSTLFTMPICSTVKPGCIRKQNKKVLFSFRHKRHLNNCFLAISFYLP